MDAKLTYGRLDTEGTGTLGQLYPNPPDPLAWREEKHRSHYYGAAANFGLPLMFANGLKALVETGIDYKKLRTKSHDAYHGDDHYRFSKLDSTSITIPTVLTVHKDFQQCWGIVTPKLSLGWTKELDDTGDLVRVYNASAAATVKTDLGYAIYESGHKDFYRFGIGFDLKTVGGWDVRADYIHYWADKYRSDTFKLELGRCF